MAWNVDLSKVLIAGARFGGALALVEKEARIHHQVRILY